MIINISENAAMLGSLAAEFVEKKLNEAIKINGEARLLVSTGSSQFETLQALAKSNVEWSKVELFHLDEYIDLPVTHKASFRKYLNERFVNHIDIKKFYAVEAEGDIDEKIKELTNEVRKKPIDVGLIGIGENAHIAFNDPPADFDTDKPFLVATLDEQCRRQQMNEGWFPSVSSVPAQAISMSIKQIMLSAHIICSVPGLRKAEVVRDCLNHPVSNLYPAGILKNHASCFLFLDRQSASLISSVPATN